MVIHLSQVKMVPSFLTDKLVVASVLGVTVTAATTGVVWWYITRGGRLRKTPGNLVFRPVGKLSDIWIHPVKSCRGYQVTSAEVTPVGISSDGLSDRYFLVLDETDTFISMRREPSMALLRPKASEDGEHLIMEAPGMDPLSISLPNITNPQKQLIGSRVWGLNVEGLYCGEEAEAWLSSFFKKPGHKLALFKPGITKPRRLADDRSWGPRYEPHDNVCGFPDLAPLMITTEASLEDLNSRLEKPVTIRNLRPNMVVSGANPFEEDEWKYVKMGDCVMRRSHGCGRCKLTMVDPESGTVRGDGEPLATLKQYRVLEKSHPDSKLRAGAPIFGSNLVCEMPGVIQVGDTVYAAV